MGTAKFNQWLNSDGTENYKCRAWVNFNGTGTVAIRASGNVSSITDNGTGDYTVNFTTAMPDANYSTVLNVRREDTFSSPPSTAIDRYAAAGSGLSVSAVRVHCGDQAAQRDSSVFCVAIFR